MSKNQGRQSLHRFSGQQNKPHKNFIQKPKFNRDFLSMIAGNYYGQVFPHLKGRTGWQKVQCVFHDDTNPSLSVSLDHGGFRCFGCDASGDLVKFHMMRQQKTFNETINDLNAWEY